jgi:tetratricopeptide (TPR) repeat protein
MAQVLDNTADLQERAGDAAAAADTRRRATEITRRLLAADAENEDVKVRTADKDVAAAVTLLGEGQRAAAIPKINRALTVLADAAANNPGDSHAGLVYMIALENAVEALGKAGLYRASEARARELLAKREQELSAAPDDVTAKAAVSRASGLLAIALDGQSQLDKALEYRRRQLALEESLTAREPGRRRHLAWVSMETGLLLWRLSRRREAAPYYARQAELLEALWKADPSDGALGLDLGQAWLNVGELRALNGDGANARAAFARCLEVGKVTLQSAPNDPAHLIALAWGEARMAELGDTPVARWRRVEALLVRADRIHPLADQEDELLTVARISQATAGTASKKGN